MRLSNTNWIHNPSGINPIVSLNRSGFPALCKTLMDIMMGNNYRSIAESLVSARMVVVVMTVDQILDFAFM